MDSFYFEVVKQLNQQAVEYMVVGGFAVNFYGYNRSTGDLDLWISNTETNLSRLKDALEILGYKLPNEVIAELKNDRMVTFSNEDCVVELMTRLNISVDVSFEEAFKRAEVRIMDEIAFSIISFADLKNEKSRSKRYKDLDDLSKLEEAEAYYGKKSEE